MPQPFADLRWRARVSMVAAARILARLGRGVRRTRPAKTTHAGVLMAASAEAGFPAGAGAANLDVSWIHGSEAAKYNTDPDIQVHAYDEHTYILRQNMAVHYEAPFMFLLFGGSRAVLIDTGATPDPRFFPLRRTVDAIIDGWLASQPHAGDYGLLVLHTHSHTDHTAADGQFADRPNTEIVGAKRDDAWPCFVRSIDRLAEWCAQRPVTYLLGCHIEMTTTPGVDYPAGWSYQPDEPPLQLTTEHLKQVQATLKAHNLQPGRYVLPQMIITPVG